jgi:hypothetical protein
MRLFPPTSCFEKEHMHTSSKVLAAFKAILHVHNMTGRRLDGISTTHIDRGIVYS